MIRKNWKRRLVATVKPRLLPTRVPGPRVQFIKIKRMKA